MHRQHNNILLCYTYWCRITVTRLLQSRVSYQALVKRCQYGCALDCNRRLYLGPDALPPEAEEEEDEDNAQPTRNAIRKRRALPGPASVNRHFHLQDDLWSTRSTQVQVMLMQVGGALFGLIGVENLTYITWLLAGRPASWSSRMQARSACSPVAVSDSDLRVLAAACVHDQNSRKRKEVIERSVFDLVWSLISNFPRP